MKQDALIYDLGLGSFVFSKSHRILVAGDHLTHVWHEVLSFVTLDRCLCATELASSLSKLLANYGGESLSVLGISTGSLLL